MKWAILWDLSAHIKKIIITTFLLYGDYSFIIAVLLQNYFINIYRVHSSQQINLSQKVIFNKFAHFYLI
jgi:5-methylthioribose kinase